MIRVVAGSVRAPWAGVVLVGSLLATTAAAGQAAPRRTVSLVPQIGHGLDVTALAVTPEGGLAVTASADNTLVVWDVRASRELRRLTGHGDAVTSVALDPERYQALSASADGTLRLWDLETGRELARYAIAESRVDGFLRSMGRLSARGQMGRSVGVLAAALDPGGRYVAGRTADGLHVWERSTGTHVWRLDRRTVEYRYPRRVGALAFAPDGRTLVSGYEDDDRIRRWDMRSGDELDPLGEHDGGVTAVIFSRDGRFLLTGSLDGKVRLHDASSGLELERYTHDAPVTAVALSPDNRYVAAAAGEAAVYGWDRGRGGARHSFAKVTARSQIRALAVDSVGHLLAGALGSATIWNLADGSLAGALFGSIGLPRSLALDGASLFVGAGRDGWRWDLEEGRAVVRYPHDGVVSDLAVSSGGDRLVIGATSGITVRDPAASEGIGVGVPEGAIGAVGVSADGNVAITGSENGAVRLWRIRELDDIRGELLGRTERVWAAAVHPDGRLAATVDADQLRLWDLEAVEQLGSLRRGDAEAFTLGSSVEFSPNGRYVLAGSGWGDVRLWDLESRSELRELRDHVGRVDAVAFDHTGKRAYTAGDDQVIRLWDIDLETVVRRYEGHGYAIRDLAVWPDGRWLASASQDGTTRIWDVATGELTATLVVDPGFGTRPARWAVIAPDGRFDTNRLEEVEGIYWTVFDDPMTALPLEIFMRDYYQPRLLPRLLAGEPLPEVRDVSDLNRAQPQVRITVVETLPGTDSARVTVEVAEGSHTTRRDGREARTRSGVHDLRLFRDGRLVAVYPDRAGPQQGGVVIAPGELPAWRTATHVATDAGPVTFRVALPKRAGIDTVSFSAYAFNEDRVKSATARTHLRLPRRLRRPGRQVGVAYVVSIGVADNKDPGFGLSFPAEDVRLLTDSLAPLLARSGAFGDTVTLPLVTRPRRGTPAALRVERRTAGQPTKAAIRGVIDRLAGRPVAADAGVSADALARLAPATPDDLVVLTFSGHGVTNPANGEFYLVPYDIGDAAGTAITPSQLERSISAAELSAWLRDVDAGRVVLVIGSCYSTAAVEQEGFKPGPMGDRGLGQLAYDKAIQVLAAAQSEATEAAGHGLLAFALAVDGLAAARRPDGPRTLTDLLVFARDRLPDIHRRWRRFDDDVIQQASLFDFKPQQIAVPLAPPGAGGSHE